MSANSQKVESENKKPKIKLRKYKKNKIRKYQNKIK